MGKDGALMPLIKKLVEAALEGEMDNHLSEEKNNGNSNRLIPLGIEIVQKYRYQK